MEHIAALLLIVGCSGDLKQCTEMPSPVTVYETYEECQSELEPVLSSFRGQREKLFGQCVYVDPAMEEEDAELVWDIGRDGQLHASIETVNAEVAGTIDRSTTSSVGR
ncbi:hypothetical protein RB623_05920 [Mesorhizobium sp. LHD-90]|uniref:hypothetical protein n=1 Tax=Mesorhizobium sp. LHD-90 TaxID=3071414 RepID=UPI0027DFC890|nr:hypothetical protein [Mesorhizobium sp. LHD-90]MDQ6433586.1 hypothetical protein [Mesorhizobium sp. LHD-90]